MRSDACVTFRSDAISWDTAIVVTASNASFVQEAMNEACADIRKLDEAVLH